MSTKILFMKVFKEVLNKGVDINHVISLPRQLADVIQFLSHVVLYLWWSVSINYMSQSVSFCKLMCVVNTFNVCHSFKE